MARCPNCHRRLPSATKCPSDGGIAPIVAADGQTEPPEVPGFAVDKWLGRGGFASVWEATVNGSGSRVALKIGHNADSISIEKLNREGDVLALIAPPYVPAFHGKGALRDHRPYLVMELLSGRTLAVEIEGWSGPPSVSVVESLSMALLESAAAIHLRGVLHRDFKPENVFLVDDGRLTAKLIDFGLARSAPKREAARSTSTGPGAGTPEYMSPEQISGERVDPSSDVYSLGVMLFEMMTLRLPFIGQRGEIEHAHVSLRPPRPSRYARVPQKLEEIVLRCLAKDPRRRFIDAEALRVAVSHAFERIPETSSRYPAPARSAPPTTAATKPLSAMEREKVALVFTQGTHLLGIDIQAAVEPFGGQLAATAGRRCVCAFTHRAGNHPGRRALLASEALIARNLVEQVVIDVATVVVRASPDGPPRLLSSLFSNPQRWPDTSGPPGILISAIAREMLPDVHCEPAPERHNYFVPAPVADDESPTHSRTSVLEALPPLVGRDDTLQALAEDAARAVSERRPRLATVLADAGMGKTRFATALTHQLRREFDNGVVIELRAGEPLGRDADEALSNLLVKALELPRTMPPDGGRDLLIERLGKMAAETYPGVALLLGWIQPNHPAVQALKAAPGVLRASAAKAGMEALKRLAAGRPVFVLLDDAHWANDALLDALEQATVSELPLWICAFGKPTFAESRPSWGARAAHATVQRLGPLSREAAGELCRQLLLPAVHVPDPVVTRLVERSEAVPLLLCDLVRGLKKEGLLRKRAGEIWYVATEVLDKVPDSPLVEWIARCELDKLPVELSAHARLVSLLSPEFAYEEVEGVLEKMNAELSDSFPLDARVGTERLMRAQLIVQHRTERYSFRSAATREAVAGSVPDALGLRIHQAALAYYRSAPLPDVTRIPSLAWHAARAGAHAEAAATYSTLAELARERHNYLEADLSYTRAIAELDEAEVAHRLRALKGRGIVRYRLGRYDGSLADLAQARELAVRGGDPVAQADVMLEESTALDWLFEWRRSRELAEHAHELVAQQAIPALKARVLLALGRSHHRFNQDKEAAELLREAARIAQTLGDEGYEVEVAAGLLLGFLLPFIGLPDEAHARLQRVADICQSKGDEMHLAGLWNNRSCLFIALNDRDRFMADNGRVLAYAQRMGNAHLERNANLNSAYFLYWRAEFSAAEPFARRMIEIDESYFRQGGFRPDGAVLLARILWGAGDSESARALIANVRTHQGSARAEGKHELLLQPNDEMLLDMIGMAALGENAHQWATLVERARSVGQGQELIEVLEVAGIVALRRGDRDEAGRWWQEALDAGQHVPNVMVPRITRRLSELGRTPSPPV